eukprot:44349-Chlamydomonas_euryale.AAC.6
MRACQPCRPWRPPRKRPGGQQGGGGLELVDWLANWLAGWLIGWLVGELVGWPAGWDAPSAPVLRRSCPVPAQYPPSCSAHPSCA